jgi:hypothetical protein
MILVWGFAANIVMFSNGLFHQMAVVVHIGILGWLGFSEGFDHLAIIAALLNIVYFMKLFQSSSVVIGSISFPLTMIVNGLQIAALSQSQKQSDIISAAVQLSSMLMYILEVCYESLPGLEVIYPILFCGIYSAYQLAVSVIGSSSDPISKNFINRTSNQINYHAVLFVTLHFSVWMVLCQYLWQIIDYSINKAFRSIKSITFYLGLVIMINGAVKKSTAVFRSKSFSKIKYSSIP